MPFHKVKKTNFLVAEQFNFFLPICKMLEKIAMGKLQKFYKESTLLNQEFIKDNKLTVLQYIKSEDKDLTATAFKRVSLG